MKNKDKVSFNIYDILVYSDKDFQKERSIKKEDFELLKDTIDFDYTDKKTGNTYKVTTDSDKNYIWIYVEYGNKDPRRKTLYDTDLKKDVVNLRTPPQLEFLEQVFFFYSFIDNVLFLSANSSKSFFVEILKNKLNINTAIKARYKSVDEFIKTINYISEISFKTAVDIADLPMQNQTPFYKIKNHVNGIGGAKSLSLKIKFDKRKPSENNKKLIKDSQDDRDSGFLSSLVVKGSDSEGFETIYNNNTFIRKVAIIPKITEENICDPEFIKNALIERNYNND